MIDTAQQRITALEKKVGPEAKSPLFAQLAHYYLEAKRAQDALRVCDAGLAHFPFYTTGHLIKGKALVLLNMQAEARREFEFVLDLLPANMTVTTLLSQMPPSADESVTAPESIRKEVGKQVPPVSPQYDHSIPPTAQPSVPPEPSYGFGGSEQIAPEPQQETAFVSPSTGSSFFDTITQTSPPSAAETSFGFGFEAPPSSISAEPEHSPFGGFTFPPSEPTPLTAPVQMPTDQPSGFDFTMPQDTNFQLLSTSVEEESFDQFSERKRGELTGEDTLSLEDYFNNIGAVPTTGLVDLQLPTTEPIAPISTGVQNKIEELANKLQSAGKITPVINFAQKETSTVSEQDTPAGMGFVTPTLAEIYAKQGWYDDAIKAYKTLARNKPAEKERYEKRISELEELKKQSSA